MLLEQLEKAKATDTPPRKRIQNILSLAQWGAREKAEVLTEIIVDCVEDPYLGPLNDLYDRAYRNRVYNTVRDVLHEHLVDVDTKSFNEFIDLVMDNWEGQPLENAFATGIPKGELVELLLEFKDPKPDNRVHRSALREAALKRVKKLEAPGPITVTSITVTSDDSCSLSFSVDLKHFAKEGLRTDKSEEEIDKTLYAKLLELCEGQPNTREARERAVAVMTEMLCREIFRC